MSHLTCAGCGSVYASSVVENLPSFTCSVCHETIGVPVADAAPEPAPIGRVAPAEPPPIPRAVSRPAAPVRTAAGRERTAAPGRMKSLTGLSNAVTAFFGAMILVNLASVMSRWTLIDFLEGIVAGRVPDMARAEEIDAAAEKLGIAGIAVGVGFIVTFCIWFHRAHANLRAAKLPKLEYGSGWAVGGFFVPILNLVRPFQVMKEVWLGTSFLAGAAHVTHWKRGPSTPLIGWWWALFLVSSRLGHMALRIFLRSSSASSLITAGWAEIASDVVGIAAAFLGITLVRRISELQERARWRKS